ncbi:unnamed protein product [Cyclocybe aegerita]|uniref:TauD/TfdA-like domain-containing protein n=1 Tax=Cyclocybe aegerita TaxID=1973307 RepID=A0A8S0X1G7_CYCAE|nr:unnamed protein product [Cyclocybe aegerita]
MAAALVDRVTDLFKSNLDINASTPEVTSEKNSRVDVVEVVIDTPKQPEIDYHPNEAQWKARTARRLAEDPSLPQTALPAGFPKKLESPLVWDEKDWTDASQWEYKLSAEQLKEIDDAVKHFKSLNKPFGYLSPSTFPLPTLGPILKDLSHELHNGRGFFVVKTIPIDSYTREENTIIYAGVSSHVGALRGVQDKGVSVVGHIKDLTATHPLKTIGGPAYTTDKQVFHTDAGDIISLYVLETAAEGGTSRISSSWRVYNELAETRPDLIKTLSEPWPFDGYGVLPSSSRSASFTLSFFRCFLPSGSEAHQRTPTARSCSTPTTRSSSNTPAVSSPASSPCLVQRVSRPSPRRRPRRSTPSTSSRRSMHLGSASRRATSSTSTTSAYSMVGMGSKTPRSAHGTSSASGSATKSSRGSFPPNSNRCGRRSTIPRRPIPSASRWNPSCAARRRWEGRSTRSIIT